MEDPDFHLTATFGRLFFIVYVICMVIVGLNMLIAMMNNSFDRILVRVKVHYLFTNFYCLKFEIVLLTPVIAFRRLNRPFYSCALSVLALD